MFVILFYQFWIVIGIAILGTAFLELNAWEDSLISEGISAWCPGSLCGELSCAILTRMLSTLISVSPTMIFAVVALARFRACLIITVFRSISFNVSETAGSHTPG